MKCPKCGGDSVVRKTQNRKDRAERFRTCKACYTNFVTVEVLKAATGKSQALKEKYES